MVLSIRNLGKFWSWSVIFWGLWSRASTYRSTALGRHKNPLERAQILNSPRWGVDYLSKLVSVSSWGMVNLESGAAKKYDGVSPGPIPNCRSHWWFLSFSDAVEFRAKNCPRSAKKCDFGPLPPDGTARCSSPLGRSGLNFKGLLGDIVTMHGASFSEIGWDTAKLQAKNCFKSALNSPVSGTFWPVPRPPFGQFGWKFDESCCGCVWFKFYWNLIWYGRVMAQKLVKNHWFRPLGWGECASWRLNFSVLWGGYGTWY